MTLHIKETLYLPIYKLVGCAIFLTGVFSFGIFIGQSDLESLPNRDTLYGMYNIRNIDVTNKYNRVPTANAWYLDSPENDKDADNVTGSIHWTQVFHFAQAGVSNCNLLYYGSLNKVIYSPEYHFNMRIFENLWNEIQKNLTWIEGHIGQLNEQLRVYQDLASQPFVHNICEIGFNAGHSSLQWLLSNKHAHVFSFDIGSYGYTKIMAGFLQSQFPGRLTIFYGNSTVTVPIFAQMGHLCDLLVIDGGHIYETAKADLVNMRKVANPLHNIVIFDDYPSNYQNYMKVLGRAWNEVKGQGHIAEVFRCMYEPQQDRGFTVGRYIFPHQVEK